MVFFLMVLKALVAATRAVVCSWAEFPKFYTGLLCLVLVPGMALAVCLPLLHPDMLVAGVITSLIVTIVVLLLVGGLGWAIGASNAMGAISPVLIDLEDMLDEFITRLNPQYGLDIISSEEKLRDDLADTKAALDKADKRIDMADHEIESLEDRFPCQCPDEEAGCPSANCACRRQCECDFKAAQWHGCSFKGCKRPCLGCHGECGAVGTEECNYW